VAETWAWPQADGRSVERPRWVEHGSAPDKETKILAALGQG
jgi:hypothetical protein